MIAVKDELDSERIKVKKLEKLIQQYTSSSSSVVSAISSAPTVSTASKGTISVNNGKYRTRK